MVKFIEELKAEKKEYAPVEKIMKQIYFHITPTATVAYYYPDRKTLCQDRQKLFNLLAEVGI